MGRSKRKKGTGNGDILSLPHVAKQQQQQQSPTPALGFGGSPLFQSSLEKLANRAGMGSSGSQYHLLPTITRGPGPLRQHSHGGSPLHRTPGNQAAVSKIEYLSKIATWAAASVPSLGAFYGQRLASTCQVAGIPSPVLKSQCERCESVLTPGVNCSVRVAPKKKTRRKKKDVEATETINTVVYQCHYCKYGNQKPGTPKQYVKTKLAQGAALAQMKDLACNYSTTPSAKTGDTSPVVQGVTKASTNPSTTPVTPAVSLRAVFSPASALQVDHGLSKKRKRKGWTGLKAIATSLQNRGLSTPERLDFAEDFTSLLNPRKKGSL